MIIYCKLNDRFSFREETKIVIYPLALNAIFKHRCTAAGDYPKKKQYTRELHTDLFLLFIHTHTHINYGYDIYVCTIIVGLYTCY